MDEPGLNEAERDTAPEAAGETGAQARNAGWRDAEPKCVLFTTSSGDEAAAENLRRMIEGLRAQGDLRIHAVLLVQQDEAATQALVEKIDPPAFMEVVAAGGRMSLSAARNRMLEEAAAKRLIGSEDLVAFPDDSWYAEGFLAKVQSLFLKDPFFDFFFCRYGSKPEPCDLSRRILNPTAAEMVANASSNTVFLRGRVANAIGGFDPDLGVGTKNKAGEDLDYAIRAYFKADQTAYLDAQAVGHRDKDTAVRAKYYRGSLIVLGRYALWSGPMMWLFLRKLAIGGFFGLSRRLSPGELASSIGAALYAFGRGGASRAEGRA